MNNTIILEKGTRRLSRSEYNRFKEGDTIWDDNSDAKELKRWRADQEEEAKEELKKYKCKMSTNGDVYDIEEYALKYCECDDDGEFICGSDFDLAEEE